MAFASACTGADDGRGPDERWNVLMIVVDTLRRDHVGCYGHERPTTPELDRLARDSVRYDRAISPAPWTTPSIGALMTSRWPSQLGIRDDRSVLAEDEVLLAETLRAHGWHTGAVISHSFCSSRWRFDQGFDSFDETQILGTEGISSQEVSSRALRFLEQAAGGNRPFFLWLHYFDPHWRYMRHEAFEFERSEPYEGPIEYGLAMRTQRVLAPSLRPADVAELERQYDSEIAFTDHHVGRVLDALRSSGQYDRTLIVFVADHGEEFKDHGALGHAHTLHHEVLDVPLVVRIPGVDPAVVRTPVSTLDVFPTVLKALGLPVPASAIGRPLPLVDTPGTGRVVFSETSRDARLRAAQDGRYKVILDLDEGRAQVYDLETDPGELHPLAGELPPGAARVVSALHEWTRELDASERAPREIEIDADRMKELRELGYGGD